MLKFIKGVQLNLSADHSNGVEEDEPDRPPVMVITVIVLLSFVFLIIVAIFTYILLWKSTESLQNKMSPGMENETRINYLKQQEGILSSYGKLENGLYQIPISEAMHLVVKEQSQ